MPIEENNFITIEDLDSLLDKYFYGKEYGQEKIDNFIDNVNKYIESQEKEKDIYLQNEEVGNSTTVELHNELISEIKVLQENTKLGNNLLYFSITILLLVFCTTLFYKFLRNFI